MPTLSAQYVEQNLPAAIRGGDVLMALSFIFGPLRSVPMGVRWSPVSASVLSSTYWTRSSARDVGLWHPADHRRTVAKRQLLLISLWLLMRKS